METIARIRHEFFVKGKSIKEIDGDGAKRYQADKTSPVYRNNCTASIEEAREAMKASGASSVTITKGWFIDTLPKASFPDGIAILRMDGDWYDSTMQVLDSLYQYVAEKGLIIVDDYFAWQGCTKAIHDFLSKNKLPLRIRERDGVCYIINNTKAE